MSDDGRKDEDKKAADAQVWARGGEGPHTLMPAAAPDGDAAQEAIAGASGAGPSSLSAAATAPENSTAAGSVTASQKGNGERPAAKGSEISEPSGSAGGSGGLDGEADGQPSENGDDGKDGEEAEDSEASDGDEDDQGEDGDEGVAAGAEADAQPVSDGTPTKNDIAVGYVIPLVIFFVGYLVNMFAGGYCLSSERMNALSEICFFWTPALCALCLLAGSKSLKIAGAIGFLPLAAGAVFACDYFHSVERFGSEVGPYGHLADAYDANGWRICHYESSWTSGNQPGTTYTRERDAAPYVRYVRKMRIGEPP